jgi:hypothetical protein
VGLLAGLFGAGRRWQAEVRNRSVEITLEADEVRRLAAATGTPFAVVLARFQRAGVVSLAVSEETIGSSEEARQLEVLPGPTVDSCILRADPAEAARIALAVEARTPLSVQVLDRTRVQVNQPYAQVRGLGIGLDPQTVALVRGAGLTLIGRIANWQAATPGAIAWSLERLRAQGVTGVIFTRDEVLGYKAHLPETAAALAANGLIYGTVEFGKQKGDLALTRLAAERTVRVHTVTGEEMQTADIDSNVSRFLLAARERNIRLLFVRLFPSEPDPLETNARYVEKIVRGLARGRLTTGTAHGYGPLSSPLWVRFGIGLGLAAAFVLLVDTITGFLVGGSAGACRGMALIAVLVAALPAAGMLGAKLAALLSASLFPALGVLLVAPLQSSFRAPLVAALRRFVIVSAVTGIGIVFLVGLLADRLFLIKADGFAGIKVAQLIPLALVALVLALDLQAESWDDWTQRCRSAWTTVLRLAGQPIFFWQAVAGLIALVVLALLVMRSGNDPGVGVSAFELKIRALLDRLLYARPRFKEFLVHPILLLGLALAARRQRAWALPLVLVGTIGQVSFLNTFCHLHTPLLVSLWRAGLGLFFGLLLGLALIGIAERLLRSRAAR